MKEKFIVLGSEHQPPEIIEVEVKPLTIIVKEGDFNGELEPMNRLCLTPKDSLYHAERCKTWHTQTQEWVERLKPGAFVATDLAALHLRGLVDLSLKLRDMQVPFMWRYPETFLHPKVQCELADFFIFLAKPSTAGS